MISIALCCRHALRILSLSLWVLGYSLVLGSFNCLMDRLLCFRSRCYCLLSIGCSIKCLCIRISCGMCLDRIIVGMCLDWIIVGMCLDRIVAPCWFLDWGHLMLPVYFLQLHLAAESNFNSPHRTFKSRSYS